MNEFLTPAEIHQLTDMHQPSEQLAALEKLGVPVRKSARKGRPIVSREHVRRWLDGGQPPAASAPRMDLVR